MSARDRDRSKVLHEVWEGAFDPEARGRAVRGDGALGAEAAGPDEEGGRRRDSASAARAAVESEDRGGDAAEGGEVGEEQVRGFWSRRAGWPASTWGSGRGSRSARRVAAATGSG
jgi:hypothetical protein